MAKQHPQWQVVYQKLFFARRAMKAAKLSDKKADEIYYQHIALMSLYASLNAFCHFISARQEPLEHLFSMKLLKNWSDLYASSRLIDRLSYNFTQPYWLKLWNRLNSELSAIPMNKVAAPNQPSQKTIAVTAIETSELTNDISCWAQMLEDFYDECAIELEEY